MWLASFALLAQVTFASPPTTPHAVADFPLPAAYVGVTQDADPADSLLRVASQRMARADYRGAAELYRAAVRRFPSSMRLSEAMYYEAFALYRAGELTQARTALSALSERYPRAAAQGDASALRTRICGELARQGDSACAEEVARLSTRATTAGATGECDDNESGNDTRIAALNALLQMDAERAMPILTNVLARRDRCSEPLRRKAVFLVAQKQTRDAANVLLNAAKNDPDRQVREQAVFWLSQVRDPRALEILMDIATNGTDRGSRERALFALSQHADPAAAAALRTFAENEREPIELRERAIMAIGQRQGGAQGDYLRTLYRRIQSPALREKVMVSMSQQRGGNAEFLLGIARDPAESSALRMKAIFWAGQTGASLAQLEALYSTLPDRELREQVIFALSQRRESAAVDLLMAIAKSDPDRELRKKAVFWLGQSRDPRATTFLTELINK